MSVSVSVSRVPFDAAVARAYQQALRNGADSLRGQAAPREKAMRVAIEGFKGPYRSVFVDAVHAERDDRARLAGKMEDLADDIARASLKAQDEQKRLDELHDWQMRRSELIPTVESIEMLGILLGAQPSTNPIAPYPVQASFSVTQRRRTPNLQAWQSGFVSAQPGSLRSFVSRSEGLNAELSALQSEMRSHRNAYNESCSWAPEEAGGLTNGFADMLTENTLDAEWMGLVAAAFEAAGSRAQLVSAFLNVVCDPAPSSDVRMLEELIPDLPDELVRVMIETPPAWLTPDVLGKWWEGLSPRQQSGLIDRAPLFVGNANGIPLRDRIRANQTQARRFLLRTGLDGAERDYWLSVAKGSRRVVVCDPELSRMIEMIGDMSRPSDTVLTYLPGTTATLNELFQGSLQQTGESFVNLLGNEHTVAFVYMDKPWITWTGATANSNRAFLEELGIELARFQAEAVQREPMFSEATIVGMGHSAGLTPLAYAEDTGTKFDAVISLAGSFELLPETSNPDTLYLHYQYASDMNDAIHVANLPIVPSLLPDIDRLNVSSFITPTAAPRSLAQVLGHQSGMYTPGHLTGQYRVMKFSNQGMSALEAHSHIATGLQNNRALENDLFEQLEHLNKER